MKSRSGKSKPCPCGGSCYCHNRKEKIFPLIFPIVFPLLLPGLFPGLLILLMQIAPQPPVRHIWVNNKECVVKYVTDGCTSTGACNGHDEAVCP